MSRPWRAVVTWVSGVTEDREADTESEALDQAARWQRLNPGDIRDVGVERLVERWERVHG